MAEFSDFVGFVPFPVVDLHNVTHPHDGVVIRTPPSCESNFRKGHQCREHYKRLRESGNSDLVQCPFGFCSISVMSQGVPMAITGLIPFPRIGGESERIAARNAPENKIAATAIKDAATAIVRAVKKFEKIEHTVVNKHSMALHEIRKLNRTVKQTAERICMRERPEAPDTASNDLVQIWKTAELMSRQFDVIEILANEALTSLPLNNIIEIYRLFDKCVRIYRFAGPVARSIALYSIPNGYSGLLRACDKTLSIIPTVLIENALKYSLPATEITITVQLIGKHCVVRVTNLSKGDALLDPSILEKGVRGRSDKEGSGHGLYLARLVAHQHGGELKVESYLQGNGVVECCFVLKVPAYVATNS